MTEHKLGCCTPIFHTNSPADDRPSRYSGVEHPARARATGFPPRAPTSSAMRRCSTRSRSTRASIARTALPPTSVGRHRCRRIFASRSSCPKVITHEARLVGRRCSARAIPRGDSWTWNEAGPILVQLPPSFAFDSSRSPFFTELRSRFEWRSRARAETRVRGLRATWKQFLFEHRVARVAADPARVPAAAGPADIDRIVYIRLHGSPRVYYSAYPPNSRRVRGGAWTKAARGVSTWCIFDNTALERRRPMRLP